MTSSIPTSTTSPSNPTTEEHRERIWAELRRVGRPDSRFHWDFSSFIADFEGSDDCARRVRELDAYRTGETGRADGGGGPASTVFITPDNSTEALREQVITDSRPILMTTYGIGRGFLLLEAGVVPAGMERYAATLDGMDTYARPITLAEIADRPTLGLLVTGGSAVSRNGVRFGKGHGYFDVEWALLSEIGAVDEATQVADVVHDCQVVDEVLEGEDHDVPVDWILTPSATLAVPDSGRLLGRIRWELLTGRALADTPPLRELRATSEPTTSANPVTPRPPLPKG